jgi:DNA-binding MarR family transcriptional regulator
MSAEPSPERDFQIGALLNIPAFELQKRVEEALEEAGMGDLRRAHHPVLQHLDEEGSRVTDLADRMRVTKQAVAYLVDYLERRGYLDRVPDPYDGRAALLRRTERAWEVHRIARRVVEDVQREWADHLGEARMRELRALLKDLVVNHIGVRYSPSIGGLRRITKEPNRRA